MSITPPRLLSEPLPVHCVARSTALGVRDLLLLLEEDVSVGDLRLLFLRARLFWTTEWVECDGIVAGRGLPSCRGRCHQILQVSASTASQSSSLQDATTDLPKARKIG